MKKCRKWNIQFSYDTLFLLKIIGFDDTIIVIYCVREEINTVGKDK